MLMMMPLLLLLLLLLLYSDRTKSYIQLNENQLDVNAYVDLCTFVSARTHIINGSKIPTKKAKCHLESQLYTIHASLVHSIWELISFFHSISRIRQFGLAMGKVQFLDLCSNYHLHGEKRVPHSIAHCWNFSILPFTIVWHHFHSFYSWHHLFVIFSKLISYNLFILFSYFFLLLLHFIVFVDDWIHTFVSPCCALFIFMPFFVHTFHKSWAVDLHLFNFQFKWCRQSLFLWLLLLHLPWKRNL